MGAAERAAAGHPPHHLLKSTFPPQAIGMTSSLFVLHSLPHANEAIVHPYVPDLPAPIGRDQPNGTMIVTDEARPSLLYKFSPWDRSALAFAEIEAYARLRGLADNSGIVQLEGVSGTDSHLVRIVERSHRGALDKFLLDATQGDVRSIDGDLVYSLIAQIAETMAHLHAHHQVHRDLKAENILVFDADANARDWRTVRAKVSDFDRAVELSKDEFLAEPVGSLFHMAPELLARRPYDRKVDVYAFGILMFEVAHGGARPYSNIATGMPGSHTREEFSSKVIDEAYRPAWLHGDERLQQIASRCWATDPDERPEFQEIFEALRAGSPWHKSPRSDERRQKTRLGAIEAVGIGTTIGKQRRTMEDAVCTLKTPDALIAGVFDGLRGARTSTFAARRLAMTLADTLAKAPSEADAALRNSFDLTEATLRRMTPLLECGSTATVVLLRDVDLHVAWLGDSPAYLFRKAGGDGEVSVIPLVNAHLPDREDEAIRVTSNGGALRREQRMLDSGEAVPWGPLRVFVPDGSEGGGVALSRALGLFAFKPAVGDEPDVMRLERHDDDLFLVVASDGVFGVLTPEDAYRIIAGAQSAQDAADAIIDAVLANGAPDNASVVVVDLRASNGSACLGGKRSSQPIV